MPLTKVHNLRCLMIADDLTGSCDAAVHFAVNGMTAEVTVSERGMMSSTQADVIAVNTDSRCVAEEVAARRVYAAFQGMDGRRCDFFFKKIDSSLRGNVFAEVKAAADAGGSELVFVAPALPALNRPVRRGKMCLASGDEIDVGAALHPLRLASVSADELKEPRSLLERLRLVVESGVAAIGFDAETDEDLDAIVALGLACGRCVLWVGSAGLAGAIARSVAGAPGVGVAEPPLCAGPVLLGVGSDHAATLAQVRRLREKTPLLECSVESFSEDAVRDAVECKRNVLLHLRRGVAEAEHVLAFAETVPLKAFGGIVLTGGDTASRFLHALGAHTLQVKAEVVPGIPVSAIRGGIADDMLVVTKSGAFGCDDAFVRCIAYLQRPGKWRAEGSGGQ